MFPGSQRKRKVTEQVVPDTNDSSNPFFSTSSRGRSSSLDFKSSTNPFADPNYPIPDFENVYNLMRDPTRGMPVSDRRWRIVHYSKCFVGSEAVQWIMKNLSCDRDKAVSIGQRLMEAGIIHHVTHSEPFSDAYYFYRFQEDDDTNILNMKRVWDPSIPTRDAVEVSKDLLTRLALLCEEHRKRILATQPTSQVLSETPGILSAPYAGAPATSNIQCLAPSTPRMSDPSVPTRSLSPSLSGPLISSPSINRTSSGSLPPTSFALNAGTGSDDIDYSALAKSDVFRKYTLRAAELQRVQLVALNHDERIAFFVNIYNVLCLHAHIVYGVPNSVYRRYTFFRALSYRVAGLDLTLDDIEHGILRGNKRPPMIKFLQQLRPSDPKCQHVITNREGRIHFVISAGTRSDPPIRILDGENVQEELHFASLEFLSVTVKVDTEKRTVALPRILYWYAEDFPTPEKQLLLWVARYLPVAASNNLVTLVDDNGPMPAISYENFDWANAEARFNSSIVRRKRRKLERERSSLIPAVSSDAVDGLFTPHSSVQNSDAIDGLFTSVSFQNSMAPIISADPLHLDPFMPSKPMSHSNVEKPVGNSTANAHSTPTVAATDPSPPLKKSPPPPMSTSQPQERTRNRDHSALTSADSDS